MAGKIKHLLERDGRFYSRLVVPKALRQHLGDKSELRSPLGPDRRTAERAHPAALADLQLAIRQAEKKAEINGQQVRDRGRQPLTIEQIVALNYQQRLDQDDHSRRSTLHAQIQVDDGFAAALRAGMAGKLDDMALADLVGHRIERNIELGYTDARAGSLTWRTLAIALCASEYEVLERVYERDDGVFDGQPKHPLVAEAIRASATPAGAVLPPLSLMGLFDDYLAAKKFVGQGHEAARRWAPVFKHLREHLGHNDARKITKKNLMNWRDGLLLKLTPKTVADVYLAAVRTILNWAVSEDCLEKNVAESVRQQVPKKNLTREKGFTEKEAGAILAASRAYRPNEGEVSASREYAETRAAKRWVPVLCAHTGARVSEMTQLRGQDVRLEGETWVIRITPDAGTVKAGGYRDVPLHRQLVELGFPEFAKDHGPGPLFYRSKTVGGSLSSARTVSGRLSEWLGTTGLIPNGVAPNHGWRHRFKTVGRDVGASDRVLDAICGHSGKTTGDDYGDVTLGAKKRVIDSTPPYKLTAGAISVPLA